MEGGLVKETIEEGTGGGMAMGNGREEANRRGIERGREEARE